MRQPTELQGQTFASRTHDAVMDTIVPGFDNRGSTGQQLNASRMVYDANSIRKDKQESVSTLDHMLQIHKDRW